MVGEWVGEGMRGVALPFKGEGVEKGGEGLKVVDTRAEPELLALPLAVCDPHTGDGEEVAPLPVCVPAPLPPKLPVARRERD